MDIIVVKSLFLIAVSISMLMWVRYQFKLDAVYTHQGLTIFSKVKWHSRKKHFFMFWYTIIGETSLSLYILYVVYQITILGEPPQKFWWHKTL